jgi:hypothetical protein
MELAAAGDNMKKLREIARVHIARCEAGDMQAIKDLADRLDGRPAGLAPFRLGPNRRCRLMATNPHLQMRTAFARAVPTGALSIDAVLSAR